jgi:hypothetical protein
MSPTRQRRQGTRQTSKSGSARDTRGADAGARGGEGNAARSGRLSGAGAGGDGQALSLYGQAAEAEASSSDWAQVLAGNRLLRRGVRGRAVEALQELLLQGGQRVQVDGDFGPGTERAVRAVQAAQGLLVDGVVGGGTARALTGTASQVARGDRGHDTGPVTDPGAATTLDEVRVSAGSFEREGLRAGVFDKALTAFETAWHAGETERLIFTVIDYELPSSDKRMWVIDLGSGELLFHEYVTHGSGSDRDHDGRADSMSNVNNSNASNVGLMRTDETYHGSHGESLRLDGLERGFNHNARRRAIVMHSASYATDGFRERHGKMGRSQGCPALDPDVAGDIIRTIRNGTLIFGYYPDPAWLEHSRYINP